MNTPIVNVLSGVSLPTGEYEVWFGVSYPMDGVLNIGTDIVMYNHSRVIVQ